MRQAALIAAGALAAAVPAAAWADPPTPDAASASHVVVQPSLRSQPSSDQTAPYMPMEAARAGISGQVTLSCGVNARGVAVGCSVAEETPPGQNFGDAAMLVVQRLYRFNPMLLDGKPVDGGRVRISIAFGAR